ncbi:MAG: adenosine deaminase [Candidatus Eisenbacteria bacterium]
MREFIRRLPKAELHLHIEGSLEPELMFELAGRNRIDLPYRSTEEVREAYDFRDLQSFLDVYYQAMNVLRTERDFADLMTAYLDRAAEDGVKHAEIFFDPQAHTARGISLGAVIDGLTAGQTAKESKISSKLILSFLRHLPAQAALETLDAAVPFLDRIDGVGLDSSEAGFPPSLFTQVFERAAKLGLRRVVHAGEEGPAEYVRSALDDLGAERIDHGVRAIDAPDLVARLAAERVPLTMCPLSNQRLQVTPDLRDHPLKELLDAGVRVTVNSDDPAYFGGYVAENYLAIAEALELTQYDLVTLAQNSILGSFLEEPKQRDLLAELERVRES